MRIDCPINGYDERNDDGESVYFVVIPDEWLGLHAVMRDETFAELDKVHLPPAYRTFAVSLALADDYNLPGMSGKFSYDFSKLSLRVIAWVSNVSWGGFVRCYEVPKNF